MGKDLNGLSFNDLQLLEQQLHEGMLLVKKKKVQMISALTSLFFTAILVLVIVTVERP